MCTYSFAIEWDRKFREESCYGAWIWLKDCTQSYESAEGQNVEYMYILDGRLVNTTLGHSFVSYLYIKSLDCAY